MKNSKNSVNFHENKEKSSQKCDFLLENSNNYETENQSISAQEKDKTDDQQPIDKLKTEDDQENISNGFERIKSNLRILLCEPKACLFSILLLIFSILGIIYFASQVDLLSGNQSSLIFIVGLVIWIVLAIVCLIIFILSVIFNIKEINDINKKRKK